MKYPGWRSLLLILARDNRQYFDIKSMTKAPKFIHETKTILSALILLIVPAVAARAEDSLTPSADAARALVQRVVPKQAAHFSVEIIPADSGHDVFEVE